MDRQRLVRDAAARGKYAPLYRSLCARAAPTWRATFAEIEAILGFRLPDSARRHRSWWSNRRKGGGHGHALAWQGAGWRTRAVDLDGETLVFERLPEAPRRRRRSRSRRSCRRTIPVPGRKASPRAASRSTTIGGG